MYTALQLIAEHKNAYILVDPVMGDFGKFYDKKSESLSKHIKRLCQAADLITQNLTEACILANLSYINNPSDSEIKDILIKLKTLNAKNIVLTGVVEDNIVKNYIYDQDENMYTVK
ncbi:MAG: bifunctional hydroxymethylpyrimidine kinase/phosphomethylpyrimidine kinase, partial [Clostridia bacterium]|nr:bifunctional hydroxymethylpyrimidine kinase/phosphomethylpyrimidine kinase [Clostridia bacterium]